MSNKLIEIVVEDVFDKALEFAAAFPDFKYTREQDKYGTNCRYSRGGCGKYPQLTGCIVGQAIVQAAGIDKCDVVHAWLKKLDEDSPIGVYTLLQLVLTLRPDCPITLVAKRYADGRHSAYTARRAITGLILLQQIQDHNRPWKEAVKEVKKYVDEDCAAGVRRLADAITNNLDPVHA